LRNSREAPVTCASDALLCDNRARSKPSGWGKRVDGFVDNANAGRKVRLERQQSAGFSLQVISSFRLQLCEIFCAREFLLRKVGDES
jgi:hypothetical protein